MRWGRREYRAKAFDCLCRAESIDDPEQRADMLQLARMWMSLSEPLGDIPGAYEYPSQDQRPTSDIAEAQSSCCRCPVPRPGGINSARRSAAVGS